ncbi:MAG: hypothetical protein ACAI44_33610 [Candidatus Sericytochromatia bacterium]
MPNTYVDAANFPFGVAPLTVLAGAYESRATQIAKLFVPIASYAGDTAQTLTDGSFNSNNNSVLKSSTAVLAGPSNIRSAGNDFDGNNNGVFDAATTDTTDGAGTFDIVTAKPLIIKVRRDAFTGEITAYGVFNADGTVPGQFHTPGTPLYTPGQAGDPFDPNQNPRYAVDRMTGQVYLFNGNGVNGVNLDSSPGAEIVRDQDFLTSGFASNVVGIVEFKALEGAALSTAQQRASELSNVIQSLATLIRGFKDSDRNLCNVIR